MPGYTEACTSGAHETCGTRDCRCMCHAWNQVQVAKEQQSKKGRKPAKLRVVPTEATEPAIACPQCSRKSEATDNFCRGCGKGLAGRGCNRCGEVGKADDAFCFSCGWKHGDMPAAPTLPPPSTREAAVERLKDLARQRGIPEDRVQELLEGTVEQPAEDPLIRMRRKAVEQGLIKETAV